jgi:hypothetical protein
VILLVDSLPITTGLSKKSSNFINAIIAIVSIAGSIVYLSRTLPGYIEQLECANCGAARDMSFMHYWYRWILCIISIVAGVRLIKNMTGTRRMYYMIFSGLVFVTIHDFIKELAAFSTIDIIIYTIVPLIVSVLGFIYFKTFYLRSLKRT